jgi:hypothetical protein
LKTTWAMRKKANGKYCKGLIARGFEQLEGLNNNIDSTSTPITNDTTIQIMFVLETWADWKSYIKCTSS